MAPGGDKRGRTGVGVTPGIPVAVHLMSEADDDRMAVVPDRLGVCLQVAVVVSVGDLGEVDARRIYLHQGYGALASRGPREVGLEWLHPAAVVHQYAWLDAGGRVERLDPGEGVGDSAGVKPNVGGGFGWQRPGPLPCPPENHTSYAPTAAGPQTTATHTAVMIATSRRGLRRPGAPDPSGWPRRCCPRRCVSAKIAVPPVHCASVSVRPVGVGSVISPAAGTGWHPYGTRRLRSGC